MNPFKTKEFKAQQQAWYKKLKAKGFVDAETGGEVPALKDWHSTKFQRRFSKETFEQARRYYELAGQMLHEYTFSTQKERAIWKRHADGLSIQMISEDLEVSHGTVFNTIEKLSRWIKDK